jgi:hypothetical protein
MTGVLRRAGPFGFLSPPGDGESKATLTRLPRSRARVTPSLANQPCPHIHVWSFGRFDEITDLVDKASALTLACVAESIRQSDPPTPGGHLILSAPPTSRGSGVHVRSISQARRPILSTNLQDLSFFGTPENCPATRQVKSRCSYVATNLEGESPLALITKRSRANPH